MIRALEGVIQDFERGTLTASVVVGGVHHEVRIPAFASTWAEEMESLGQPVIVHVYEYATQHDITSQLVGFPSTHERDFFRKFVDVPKVGPSRAAQALEKPAVEIAKYIETGDEKALATLPGIGIRLSQTIIAQLQGKLDFLVSSEIEATAFGEYSPNDERRSDAIEALLALQFTRREATAKVDTVIAEVSTDLTLDELIRQVLGS
jgi:Holliday junction DNA helicase RuvA